MEAHFTCQYCDHKWRAYISGPDFIPIQHKRCGVCKDTNIIIKPYQSIIIDTYIGCPKFEEKKFTEKYTTLDDYPWSSD